MKTIISEIENQTGLTFTKSISSNSWYCNERRIRISDHFSKFVENSYNNLHDNTAIDLVNMSLEDILKNINPEKWFSMLHDGVKIEHSYSKVGEIVYLSHNIENQYIEVLKINENRVVKYDFNKINIC